MDRRRWDSAWVFQAAAEIYGWMNDQPTWRHNCRRLAEHLPEPSPNTPRRILDVGCGPGMSAIALAQVCPLDLIAGLDVATRMLRQAKRRAHSHGLPPNRITWLHGDAAALPFPSASLDAVTGHSLLYLLPDRQAALAEMRRVLRPGGRVILMEPHEHLPPLSAILAETHDPRMLFSISLWRPFSRIHGRFTVDTLSSTLSEAGFTRPQVEPVLGGLGLLAWADQSA